MTAEIAILNRSAVALAADSALTITVGGSEKVYNSAEKIFEFSKKSPIGLMVYNSLDYMGFPWDVLTRRFRLESDKKFKTVKMAAEAFLAYLAKLPVTTENEDDNLHIVLSDIFAQLYVEFRDDVTRRVSADSKRPPNIRQIFHDKVNQYIEMFNADLDGNLYSNETQETFNIRYGNVSKEAAEGSFDDLPLADMEFDLLAELAFSVVRSRVTADPAVGFGSTVTGLVFAGYADGDFFPSMYSLNVDGRFFGETKSWCVHDNHIDRKNQRAIIEPFAQREMVDRFVYGVDDDLELYLSGYIREAATGLISNVMNYLNSDRRRPLKIPPDLALALAEAARDDFQSKFILDVKGLYLKDTYELVTAMPKAELAQMAEALVSLTSTKRRASLGSDTVGGPVDVAVITKGEGFVWIKRKHYFDPERNPGFFVKHYGQLNREKSDDGTRKV